MKRICTAAFILRIHSTLSPQHLSCLHVAAFVLSVSHCHIYAIAFTQQSSCHRFYATAPTQQHLCSNLTQQHLWCHIHASACTPPHARLTCAAHLRCLNYAARHSHAAALVPPLSRRRIDAATHEQPLFGCSIHAAALTRPQFRHRIYASARTPQHLRCSSRATALQVDEDYWKSICQG